jgi:hypothetical protein
MGKLERFSAPAGLPDRHPQRWSDEVSKMLAAYVGPSHPQFYDPITTDTPTGTPEPMISWVAFPAVVRKEEPSEARWKLADTTRARQDEYCEWTVERTAGRQSKVRRITFTTELPEYWEHLFHTDPKRLLTLYRKLVDPRVELRDLRGPGGYARENKWNNDRPGRLAHLIQPTNNLGAAVDLVARATIPRARNGRPVTGHQALVRCARLGEPLRHSDPQIAAAVNEATRAGDEVTLSDPVGLYLGKPLTAGMRTPDGADAAGFWKIERGDARHTVRARFEVPPGGGYVVGDIKIGGRPIEFGGQVAERVQVWISALVKDASHKPALKPCLA